jgi:hypothetical protein
VTEKELQAVVVEAANLFGYLSYHTFDSRRSARGFPDLCLARPDRVMFIELKSEKGRLTVDQTQWLQVLEKAGQEVHIWRPQQWLDGTITEVLR